MIILNLNWINLKNEILLKSRFYPWGEPSINLNDFIDINLLKNKEVIISTRIENFLDFWLIIGLLSSLKQLNCGVYNLIIPYLPWCRQDKKEDGLPFTLELYRDILASYNIKEITTYDIHSEKAFFLFNEKIKIRNITNFEIWKDIIIFEKNKRNELLIIWPDEGSKNRLKEYNEKLNIEIKYWEKIRNNWLVTNLEIQDLNIENKKIIVLDDICDWGKTVIELAKKINSKNLTLIITHWIFSKGVDELFKYYKKIITTNSRKTNFDKVKYYDLKI